MKKSLYISIILFICFFIRLYATSIKNASFSDNKAFEIISISEQEIVFYFTLPNYELINSDLDSFKKIKISAEAFTQKEGFPILPFFGELIGIPSDGYITLSVTDIISQELSNISIEPAFTIDIEHSPTSTLRTPNQTSYSADNPDFMASGMHQEHTPKTIFSQIPDRFYYQQGGTYPEHIFQIGDPFFMGLQRMQSFNFYPFRTNAINKTLTIIEQAKIVVRIHNVPTSSANTIMASLLRENHNISSALQSIVANYNIARNWQQARIAHNTQTNHTPHYADPILVSEIQLRITEEGLYKVTYEELKSQMQSMMIEYEISFSWHIDQINPKHLELSNKGIPVPIHFVGENDLSFDAGDYFEFWGEHLKGDESHFHPYSNRNIYILRLLNQVGMRMAVENGGLIETNPLLLIIPDSYDHTIHFERQLTSNRLANQISQNNLDFKKEDVLFWKTITAPAMDRTPFYLEFPINSSTRHFNTKVSIWGITHTDTNNLDHHARVWVNTALIADQRWSNQNEMIFENSGSLGNFNLTHGLNDLFIDLSGDTPMGDREQVALDYFKIEYWREFRTETNFIKFNKPSNSPIGLYQFELHNFTEEDIFVYKLGTSIIANISVQSFTEMNNPPYTVKFQNFVNTEGIQYVALSENMKKNVQSFIPDLPSDLRNPFQQADYLIVTNTEFSKAEGTLLFQSIWQSRGVNVKIIDVQDIYDEFNHGIVSPNAIRDFFRYAFLNWSEPRFSHVMLLGSGIYDKRFQSEIDMFDIIPIYKIWTYRNGATPSDNWYACIIGNDPIPDFHISRVSVFEAAQILPIAQKSQNYLENRNFQDKWHANVTLVAGGRADDGTDIFAQQNERIRRNTIPNHYQANRVYTRVEMESPYYLGNTTTLLNKINEGTSYLQFMGHGGGRIWADSDLLTTDNVRSLRNQNFPFVTSLSCFAAAFETRGMNSISEVFIAEPNKGAIGHFGFAGLGYVVQIEDSGNYLAEAFFNKDISSFGAMATYHKIRYYARHSNHHSWIAHVHGAILMGDPMLYNYRPALSGTLNLNSHLVLPGDTLRVVAHFENDITSAKVLILNDLEIPINNIVNQPVVQGRMEYEFVIPANFTEGERFVKIIGSGLTREIVAMSSFAVGNSVFIDNQVFPEQPTENDDIEFRVRVFSNDEIESLWVIVRYSGYEESFSMSFDASTGYWISGKTDRFPAGTMVNYEFILNDDYSESAYSFRILAPDLALLSISLTEKDNTPGFDVFIQNIGDIPSLETYLVLKQGSTIFNSISIPVIEPINDFWCFIGLPENLNNQIITVSVNDNMGFGEYSYANNALNYRLNSMYFKGGIFETNIVANDNNLEISIPANFLSQETWFSLDIEEYKLPLLQPDVHTLRLLDGQYSPIYKIDLLNKSLLADSTGVFAENKKMRLKFNISSQNNMIRNNLNSTSSNSRNVFNNLSSSASNSKIYRWDETTKKWISQGGIFDEANNSIITEISRTGTYTVLQNHDQTPPTIEISVEGQQFAFGGYISGTSVLSFVFADENGIDMVENPINMTLNNEPIDPRHLSITDIPERTNSIPIKYHLSLGRGEYTIDVSCWDVNGNKYERQIIFRVSDMFDLIRVANYPNPIRTVTIDPVNSGRTRFTYTLTDDADNVYLRVYTVSGRLVRSFRNLPKHVGYHEFPRTTYGWDCRDEEGFLLANGVYFYRITAIKGNQEIIRTGKLAILR
ncbi:MAG: C25 family cysteine peptidase [Candidatus Cloacimonetes bacterium]|nr:C25 family cysteine peptidase [Candidatus Cloacimonadota bacterium]